jgi:hypothetical protein
MRQLLNGVAIAAVFALAIPAFAQNAPMTPSSPPPAAPKTTTAPKPMHHHMAMTHHHMRRHHMMASEGDQMTEQLNAQELARITGGGGPAPAPAAPPSNYQTPGKSDIPPAPPPPASK